MAKNAFGVIAAELLGNKEANKAASATMSRTGGCSKSWPPRSPTGRLQRLRRSNPALPEASRKSGRRKTARRLRGVIGSVLRYAIVTLRATRDPTAVLQGALLTQSEAPRRSSMKRTWRSAARDRWLRRLADARGRVEIFCADIRASWRGAGRLAKGIRFGRAVWRISAERTKMRRQHDMPLSLQAIELLQDIWPLSEHGELVFPPFGLLEDRCPRQR